jgi:hypothetical protein
MMNFEDERKAYKIIEEVFEKTSEGYLQLRIDEPIEKAATSFEFDRDAPVTHRAFNEVIANFMCHVYKQGWGFCQEIPLREACTEAVAILDESYQSSHSRGYYAAFLDALKPELGLEYVLAQMTGHIIAAARTKHVRWVCVSRMELSDRPTRCLIAKILLDRWKPFPPEIFDGCDPAQFAHYLSELIILGISANRTVNRMFGTSVDSWNF